MNIFTENALSNSSIETLEKSIDLINIAIRVKKNNNNNIIDCNCFGEINCFYSDYKNNELKMIELFPKLEKIFPSPIYYSEVPQWLRFNIIEKKLLNISNFNYCYLCYTKKYDINSKRIEFKGCCQIYGYNFGGKSDYLPLCYRCYHKVFIGANYYIQKHKEILMDWQCAECQ